LKGRNQSKEDNHVPPVSKYIAGHHLHHLATPEGKQKTAVKA
jgi:hypothetical protein